MEQIPVRILNQDTAGVISRVEHGEVVEITSRGRPVARLVPVTTGGLADLVARGRVIPATSRGPIPMPEGAVDTATDSAEVISELREERL